MDSFSRRNGFTSARSSLQVDDLDSTTRARLWNHFSHNLPSGFGEDFGWPYISIWDSILCLPNLQWPSSQSIAFQRLGQLFLSAKFFTLFDIIESISLQAIEASENTKRRARLKDYQKIEQMTNYILEEEAVGFRLVQGRIVSIIEPEQLRAIDSALRDEGLSDGARHHLQKALSMLRFSEGSKPSDAIRESIHAVEAEVKIISGDPSATLTTALNKLARSRPLNPALREGLSKLYGYSSSEKGIRHANDSMNENATGADAIFMVVTCSAFVSWLRSHTTPEVSPLEIEAGTQ